MNETDPLEHFFWNEMEAESSKFIQPALLAIVAWGPDRAISLIGTAFITAISNDGITAMSAAHNFSMVADVQQPYRRSHASALPEFVALPSVSVDRTRLRAIYVANGRTTMCEITSVVWDTVSDIAILTAKADKPEEHDIFCGALNYRNQPFQTEDRIYIAGYADLQILEHDLGDGGKESFSVSMRHTVRIGKITQIYEDGHLLCRGRCFETSAPVFPGMSGGPAFIIPESETNCCWVGILSSDPQEDDKSRRDMSGHSIFSWPNFEVMRLGSSEEVRIVLEQGRMSLSDPLMENLRQQGYDR